MINTIDQIRYSLESNYRTIKFLENPEDTLERYRNGNVIIFSYTTADQEERALKFHSLQKMEESEKQKERESLLREYRIIQNFAGHDQIVRVFETNEVWIGSDLIGIYITMEKFASTLEQLLARQKKFSENEVKSFLNQMSNILETAHYKLTQPIIHSDIKPANIGVRETKKGKYQYALMDFDVSTSITEKENKSFTSGLSNKATLKGLTPAYAPPEQVLAQLNPSATISNRVDIYAVGAIAMQMLTGKAPAKENDETFYILPFQALNKSQQEIFRLICHHDAGMRPRIIADALSDRRQDKDRLLNPESGDNSKVGDLRNFQSKKKNSKLVDERKKLLKKLLPVAFISMVILVGIYYAFYHKPGILKKNVEKESENPLQTEIGSINYGEYLYIGGILDGKPHGNGVQDFDNGNQYKGSFINGKRQGQGTFTWGNGMEYTGEWKTDEPNGDGIMIYDQGNWYKGQFKAWKRWGNGTYHWKSGAQYNGQWQDDKKYGYGTMKWNDGREYSGYWKNDMMNGKGTMTFSDGRIQKGEFMNNQFVRK
ncbi:MAG: protein kinase [Bacteroidetes bacterium]|nr:protein kinase [Bacteroidota bacterium]